MVSDIKSKALITNKSNRLANSFRTRLIVFITILISMFFFVPSLSFAVDRSDDGIGPDGPNQTYWYQIGPLDYRYKRDVSDDTRSIEYWTYKLFNEYWDLSNTGISYFLANSAYITNKSMIDFFPRYYWRSGKKVTIDKYGNRVFWSWDEDYNNSSARYDAEYDLWWSELRLALLDPDEDKDVWRLNDYIIGRDCGNITDPTQRKYPIIKGYKINDKNGDGTFDKGEPGLKGWTIRLRDANTNKLLKTDVTDTKGYFSFDLKGFKGLLSYPKKVKLEEVLKSGWVNTRSPGEFYVYDSATEAKVYGPKYFLNFTAKITGRKYEDIDGSGVRNSGEPYRNNWTIVLRKKQTGELVDSVNTYTKNGVDGYYEFGNLTRGTYTIEEVLKSGWERTQPTSAKYTVVVNKSGTTYSPYDFGNFKKATISGRKYNDRNRDGLRQTSNEEYEEYLNGWFITLKKNGSIYSTAYTKLLDGEDGGYKFSGLGHGTYKVEEELLDPLRWVRTQPTSGYYEITVKSGETYDKNDFGNYSIGQIPISGRKYNDLSGEGQYNDGEPFLNGWTIVLKQDDQIIETKVTTTAYGKDGYYRFDVYPGSYKIEEIPTQKQIDEGWERTQPTSGYYEIIAREGDIHSGKDFGNRKGSSIFGIKYNDVDYDRQYDREDGELPLGGWHIKLTNLNDGTTQDRWTDETYGSYMFSELPNGAYKIEEIMTPEQIENGWIRTEPVLSEYIVLIDKAANYGSYNFGNVIALNPGSISGQKYEDINGDGDHDDYEPFLNGWEIILKRDGQVIQTVATHTRVPSDDASGNYGDVTSNDASGNYGEAVTNDALSNYEGAVSGDASGSYGVVSSDALNGYYEFTNLEPGTYTVEERFIEDGWTKTQPKEEYYTIIINGSGEAIKGVDFGNFKNAKIYGRKYDDINVDGEHTITTGEPFLNDWEIVLKQNNEIIKTVATSTQVVSGDALAGYYEFSDLKPGTYTIEEVLKVDEGWLMIEPDEGMHTVVVEESGKTYGSFNFGNFKKVRIEGQKYEDINGDGDRDDGEPFLKDWVIKLISSKEITSAYTDENGYYKFDNLGPDIYVVEEALKDQWVNTEPELGSYVIYAESGKIYSGNDFGNFKKVKIEGRKFEDMNANAQWDTDEPYLNGWTITLSKEGDEKFIKKVKTYTKTINGETLDGYYAFYCLGPGTYKVVEELLQDEKPWYQSKPTNPNYYTITVKSGEDVSGNDFGNYRNAKISGVKYEDLNVNRIKDEIEPTLKGWEIILTNQDDKTMTSAITDENGYYEFTGLKPGIYKLEEAMITNLEWEQSEPYDPNYYIVELKSNQAITNKNFGNYVHGKISGYKWDDKNENHEWDEGEPPLEGWKIILSKKGSTTKQTMNTNSDGSYKFEHLTADKYFISEELKGGWTLTYPKEEYHVVDVVSRTDSKGNNFGNFEYGKKSGYKWNDRSRDGKWDPGEEPLADWSIVLMKEDPISHTYKTISIDVTDTNGYYEFNSLHYGQYMVKEILKDGWMQTHPAYEDKDGNLIPLNYEFFVTSGFNEENNNFGNWHFVSFGKTKGYWQTWEKAKRYTYDEMQVFVDYVNANSTVYGEEPYGFGNLMVDEIVDRLMTNNNEEHLKGTEHALALLEAQFLTTWLNISADFQNPEMIVHLDKVKGAKELYGASELPLIEVIKITEENTAKYKEFGEGEIGDEYWGQYEFITAQKVFTLVNEAEENTGYIFRPNLAN